MIYRFTKKIITLNTRADRINIIYKLQVHKYFKLIINTHKKMFVFYRFTRKMMIIILCNIIDIVVKKKYNNGHNMIK